MDFNWGAAGTQEIDATCETDFTTKTSKQVLKESHESFMPKKRDPLDPAPLLEGFAAYEPQIQEMEAEVKALKVTDAESCAKSVEMTGQLRKMAKAIKDRVDGIFKPINIFKKAISDTANPMIKRLESMDRAVSERRLPYQLEEDRKRKAAEDRAREDARKAREDADRAAQERAKEEAARLNVPVEQVQVQPVAVAPVYIPPPVTKFTSESGATSKIVEVWEWEVADFKALPDEFFAKLPARPAKGQSVWPHTLIRAAVKAAEAMGTKPNIPGVLFALEKKDAARAGR